MQKNSRLQKTHGVIKYKAYTALLEGKINQKEHDLLVEAAVGFMDKVRSFFGGAKEVGGDMISLIKVKGNQKLFDAAKENITKAIEQMREIAKKANLPDSVVDEFLALTLKAADVTPEDIVDAAANPSKSEDNAGGGEAAAPGTEVSPDAIKKTPAVVAKLVSDATGQPVEKVEAELDKKKPDVAAISTILGAALGESEDVDPKVATVIVKTLINKGHLEFANENSLTRRGLMNFVNEVNDLNAQHEVMNRWLQLAGMHDTLLAEKKDPKKNQEAFKQIMASIEGAKIKTIEDLTQQLTDLSNKGGELSAKMKTDLTTAFERKNTKVDKQEVEKVVAAVPQAKEAPGQKQATPDEEKKAEEVKKKYDAAFKSVRDALSPEEVADETLTKVMSAIERYKSVALKAG